MTPDESARMIRSTLRSVARRDSKNPHSPFRHSGPNSLYAFLTGTLGREAPQYRRQARPPRGA